VGPFERELYTDFLEAKKKDPKTKPRDNFKAIIKLTQLQDTFECKRCGKCCIDHDKVIIKFADVKKIAGHFGITIRECRKEYLMPGRDKNNFWLKKNKDGSCIFLKIMPDGLKGCAIYQVRPTTCRRYPFLVNENIENSTNERVVMVAICPYVLPHWEKISKVWEEESGQKIKTDVCETKQEFDERIKGTNK